MKTPKQMQKLVAKRTANSIQRNGKGRLLTRVDGRTFYARRFRDLTIAHVNDMGGLDAMSAAEQSIVRRIVTLELACEERERKFAKSGVTSAFDLETYGRAANTMRRLLDSLGLKRPQRDVTPDLQDYIHGASQ